MRTKSKHIEDPYHEDVSVSLYNNRDHILKSMYYKLTFFLKTCDANYLEKGQVDSESI